CPRARQSFIERAAETLAWSLRISQTFCGPAAAAVWWTSSLPSFFWLLQPPAASESAAMPDSANAKPLPCMGPLPVVIDAMQSCTAVRQCQRHAFIRRVNRGFRGLEERWGRDGGATRRSESLPADEAPIGRGQDGPGRHGPNGDSPRGSAGKS